MEAGDGTAAVGLFCILPTLKSRWSCWMSLCLVSQAMKYLRKLAPLGGGVKVIVTSAYGPNVVAGLLTGAQLEYFIRKPYRLGDLVELVRTVLSGENAHAADG